MIRGQNDKLFTTVIYKCSKTKNMHTAAYFVKPVCVFCALIYPAYWKCASLFCYDCKLQL